MNLLVSEISNVYLKKSKNTFIASGSAKQGPWNILLQAMHHTITDRMPLLDCIILEYQMIYSACNGCSQPVGSKRSIELRDMFSLLMLPLTCRISLLCLSFLLSVSKWHPSGCKSLKANSLILTAFLSRWEHMNGGFCICAIQCGHVTAALWSPCLITATSPWPH